VKPTNTNVAYAIKNLHGKIPCKTILKTSIPLPATPVITVTKLFLVETTEESIITNCTMKNTNWQKWQINSQKSSPVNGHKGPKFSFYYQLPL